MSNDIEDIVAMARAAYRDERLADGSLYGKLAAEIERLRDALTDAVALIERLIDTRRCGVDDLRVLNAARTALEAKP
jgi:tRNA U34 5-carboxymethylaminomethyl modifying GTPase MnmE/TrmE